MPPSDFVVTAAVERFDGPNGWFYVPVPVEHTDAATRGLIPVTVRTGATTWQTSLMPMGDGTHFVALNAAVRAAERIDRGDTVRLAVTFR